MNLKVQFYPIKNKEYEWKYPKEQHGDPTEYKKGEEHLKDLSLINVDKTTRFSSFKWDE